MLRPGIPGFVQAVAGSHLDVALQHWQEEGVHELFCLKAWTVLADMHRCEGADQHLEVAQKVVSTEGARAAILDAGAHEGVSQSSDGLRSPGPSADCWVHGDDFVPARPIASANKPIGLGDSPRDAFQRCRLPVGQGVPDLDERQRDRELRHNRAAAHPYELQPSPVRASCYSPALDLCLHRPRVTVRPLCELERHVTYEYST